MELTVIPTGVFSVNSLVVPVGDGAGGDGNKCFVVDPAGCSLTGDEDKIVDFIKKEGLQCVEIVLTHFHFDHVTGIAPVKAAFPDAPIAIHEDDFSELQNPPGPLGRALVQGMGAGELINELAKQPDADIALKDGDDVFGWKVIHTPGHSAGSICLYNCDKGIMISGDTVFANGGYGRTDLPGGSYKDMVSSLSHLRKIIPRETRVFPGHDTFDFAFRP